MLLDYRIRGPIDRSLLFISPASEALARFKHTSGELRNSSSKCLDQVWSIFFCTWIRSAPQCITRSECVSSSKYLIAVKKTASQRTYLSNNDIPSHITRGTIIGDANRAITGHNICHHHTIVLSLIVSVIGRSITVPIWTCIHTKRETS